MDHENTAVSLPDVKRMLEQFAASRASKPRREVETEYGDLLLYLILLAGKSGVDLVAGANVELDRMARHTSLPAERHL